MAIFLKSQPFYFTDCLMLIFLQVFNAITRMVLRQKKEQQAKANEQSGVIKVKKDRKKSGKRKFC